MDVQSGSTEPNRRTDAEGSGVLPQKRPWQFSLSTLFAVTLVFSAFCSFLKVVPTPVLVRIVFVLYGVAILVSAFLGAAIVALAIACSVFRPLGRWIERRVSRLTECPGPIAGDRHDSERGSTAM